MAFNCTMKYSSDTGGYHKSMRWVRQIRVYSIPTYIFRVTITYVSIFYEQFVSRGRIICVYFYMTNTVLNKREQNETKIRAASLSVLIVLTSGRARLYVGHTSFADVVILCANLTYIYTHIHIYIYTPRSYGHVCFFFF